MWGIRGTLAYNAFEDKNNVENQLTLYKLMAEITVSLGNTFSSEHYYSVLNDFDIIAHACLGMSLGKSKVHKVADWMANFQIGVMSTYKISERLDILLVDMVYVVNILQNHAYSGMPTKETSGGYFFVNIGIAVRLER